MNEDRGGIRSCHELHFLWVTTNSLEASDREKPMPIKKCGHSHNNFFKSNNCPCKIYFPVGKRTKDQQVK